MAKGDCHRYDDFIFPYSEEQLVYEKASDCEYYQPNSRQVHRDYYEKMNFKKSCRIRYNAFQQISHIKVVHFKFEHTVLVARKIYPSDGEAFIERYQYDIRGNLSKKIF
jgi:hypothetical protein